MSALQPEFENTCKFSAGGTVITYPASRLYEEMAFVSYYFHWPLKDVISLPHSERQEWCKQISAINRNLGETPENIFEV